MPRVRSLKSIRPRIYIPSRYGPLYKLEIVRTDGTLDDVTNLIHSGEIIDGVTDTIGNFSFVIDNSNEQYRGVWSGNEVFNYYCDYALTATTKRFRGRIEKVSYQNQTVKITGRSESVKLLNITVTKSYSNIETSVIIKELFDTYASNFTYSNVSTSTTNVTVNWYQKPFWDCVQELCKSSGFDIYIDSSLDCHYFLAGSVRNSTDAVIHDSNLFDVGDFAYDQSLLKNTIIVYGANIGSLPLIKTAKDSDSINTYGLKELIINDTNITTETQCQERANYELNLYKNPPLTGDVTSIGLATIQPGEKIQISAPLSNLNPNYYKIVTYNHRFDGFMKTTLTIEKESRKIYHILRDRISNEQKLSETPNPNEMRYSWNFDFESDTGIHSSTQIIDGVLKTTGGSSGTWISDNKSISSDATVCELRAKGETLTDAVFSISVDGGSKWSTISLNTSLTLSPPGSTLKIKIVFSSADTQIDSLVFLYKT